MDGRRVHLGRYSTEEDAKFVRDLADDGMFNLLFFKKPRSSQYRGISFDKEKGKWRANVSLHGNHKYIGYFPTEEEAHEARKKAIEEMNTT